MKVASKEVGDVCIGSRERRQRDVWSGEGSSALSDTQNRSLARGRFRVHEEEKESDLN